MSECSPKHWLFVDLVVRVGLISIQTLIKYLQHIHTRVIASISETVSSMCYNLSWCITSFIIDFLVQDFFFFFFFNLQHCDLKMFLIFYALMFIMCVHLTFFFIVLLRCNMSLQK